MGTEVIDDSKNRHKWFNVSNTTGFREDSWALSKEEKGRKYPWPCSKTSIHWRSGHSSYWFSLGVPKSTEITIRIPIYPSPLGFGIECLICSVLVSPIPSPCSCQKCLWSSVGFPKINWSCWGGEGRDEGWEMQGQKEMCKCKISSFWNDRHDARVWDGFDE